LFIKTVLLSARIRFYCGFLLKIRDKKENSFELCGMQDPDNPDIWRAEPLTRDHKPESLGEYWYPFRQRYGAASHSFDLLDPVPDTHLEC
jgi:hypothetical protein